MCSPVRFSSVATGLVLKVLIHLKNGATFRSLFKAIVKEHRDRDTLTLTVHEAAIFSNYLGLKKRLDRVDSSVRRVVVDFDNCWVVDHTVLAKLQSLESTWKDRELLLTGFDGHLPLSHHELADRCKARTLAQEG